MSSLGKLQEIKCVVVGDGAVVVCLDVCCDANTVMVCRTPRVHHHHRLIVVNKCSVANIWLAMDGGITRIVCLWEVMTYGGE